MQKKDTTNYIAGDLSDHELLIRLDERLKMIEEMLHNHLQHHFRSSLLAWSIAGGALIALITTILTT